MASFNLDNYETVEERLAKFWQDHPEGRVLTSIHYYDENRIVVRAEIYFDRNDERPVATGYAEEIRGSSPVNRTSHVENADTSAIGRGLANCGYQSKSAPRPSRQEMEKVQRQNSGWVQKPQVQQDHEPTPQEMAEVMNNLSDAFGATEVQKPAPTIKNPGEPASSKQIGMIRVLLGQQGVRGRDEQIGYATATLGRDVESLDGITKGEASTLITSLK